MARKTSFGSDSYDFDKSLDIPDFDFDIKMPKPDGKPITRVGRGFKSGFMETVKSSAWIRNTILTALPRGYTTAADFVDSSARSVKDLYDSTVREIKPELNNLARITGRIIPKDATKDTDLMKKLRKFSETYQSPSQQAKIDPNEQNIMASLGQIFDAQQQMDDRRAKVADIKSDIREGMAQARHKDVLSQLDAIRIAVTKNATYQTTVGLNVQKKSLELQFRQYFLAIEAFAEAKRSNALVVANLEGILNNTSLPDRAKLLANKDKMGLLRNKFVQGALNGVFDLNRNFAGRLRDSVLQQAQKRIQTTMQGVRMGLEGADMATEMAESLGMPIDKYEMGGSLLGDAAARQFGNLLGNRLKGVLSRSQGIRKGGNNLQYGVDNFNALAKDWAKSDRNEKGLMGFATRFLKSAILGMPGAESGLQRDNLAGMQEPAVFDRSASKSITEIIPGYLARIYRELQVMRTGDTKTELTEYDFNAGKFKSQSENRKGIFNMLITEQGKQYTQQDTDALVQRAGGQQLTPEQRRVLGKHLLLENIRGNGALPSRLTDEKTYIGEAAPHAATFANLFRGYYADDTEGNKRNDFSERASKLGRYTQDSRGLIQQLVLNGQLEYMQELGIVDPTGTKVDLEKYYGYYYGDQDPSFTAQGVTGGARVFRAASGRKARRQPTSARQMFENIRRNRGPGESFRMEMPAPAEPEGWKDPVVETIKQQSAKPEATKIVEILERIEARLEAGVGSFSLPQEYLEKMHGNMRTLGGHARHYAGRAYQFGKGLFGEARQRLSQLSGLAGKGIGIVADQAATRVGNIRDRMRGWRDVYIKGQAIPAMQAWRLKAGEYYDQATGKVLKSWKDIRGTVVDKDGNVILTADQVKDAFVKSTLGEKLISTLGATIDSAKETFGQIFGQAKNLYGVAYNAAKGYLQDYMDGPEDVYVKGQREPVLLARLMRLGNMYFDRETKAPIRKVSDIKGPVIDADGNVVLTTEQIKTGLLNKYGRPLRTGFAKVAELVGGLAGAGLSFLTSGFKKAGELLGGGWDGFKNFFGKIIGKDGFIQIGGQKTVIERLTEIRDLLLERMPGKIRVGSVEDLRAKRKAKQDEEKKDGTGGPDGGKKGRGLLGMLGALFGGRKNTDKDSKDGQSSGGGWLESILGPTAASLITGAGKGLWNNKGKIAAGGLIGYGGAKAADAMGANIDPTTAAIVGSIGLPLAAKLLGARGSIATGAANLGGKALGALKWGKGLGAGLALGAASGAANASGYTGLGKGLEYAGDAATGLSVARMGLAGASGLAGLLGIEGGALGLAGAAAGGLATLGGSLLAGLTAIATAPVTLPALAIAATGAGLYFGYKYLTRDKLDPLSRIRYAQYGFSPDVKDYVHVVFKVEDLVKKAVVFNKGLPVLDAKKIDWKELIEVCQVDKNNRDEIQGFARWFGNRFKPVFLVHMAAINQVKPGTDLSDVDSKLTNAEKKRYFAIAKYPNGPYGEIASPIPSLKTLPMGPDEVKAVLDGAQAEIDKLPNDDKKSSTGVTKLTDIAATGAEAVAPIAAATVSDGANMSSAQLKIIQSFKGGDATGVQDNRGMVYVAGNAAAINQGWNGRVDGVSAIRFKAYGLKEMETDKVNALATLENAVADGVKFDSRKVATWSGSVPDVLAKVGPAFGVEAVNSANGTKWIQWFNLRFLPVYLNYRTALSTATGKQDVQQGFASLKPNDAVNVATSIYTSSTTSNGSSTSVWMIPVSPWPDYELNAEVASTDGNMKGLKDAAKEDKLAEQTAYDRKTTAANDGTAASSAAGASMAPTKDAGGFTGAVSRGWDNVKSFFGFGPSATDKTAGTTSGASGGMTGGSAVAAMGNGTGGAIDQLPKPTGKGYAAMKDLILAVAKMTGVDPKLMLTMAAIESGFDPSIKAGSSSATGLYQFISGTWRTMLGKYGAKYGLTASTPVTDPRANALMGAEFLKENAAALKGVKQNLTDTDMYLAHFLGAGGARKLLSADPNANAVQILPEAARANTSIFYSDKNSPRTVAQVYAEINRRVRAAGSKFGLGSGDGSEAMVAKSTAPTAPTDLSPNQVNKESPSTVGGQAPDERSGVVPTVPDASTGSSLPNAGGSSPIMNPGSTKPIIPVADTTPGSLRPTGTIPDSPAAMAGFSNRALDLTAQAKSQQAVQAAALDGVPDILSQQLDVNKQQLDVMKQIFTVIAASRANSGDTDAGNQTTNASIDAALKSTPRAVSDAPVSMRRTIFSN